MNRFIDAQPLLKKNILRLLWHRDQKLLSSNIQVWIRIIELIEISSDHGTLISALRLLTSLIVASKENLFSHRLPDWLSVMETFCKPSQVSSS
jgi:hypothetical protein